MPLSKADLIERFLNGGDSGSASRMEIEVVDGVRCIVGYGWAVYAAVLPDGRVALFGDGYASHGTNVGWAGYSGTTTGHLQDVKGALEAHGREYVVVDRELRPRSGFKIDDRPILTELDRPLSAWASAHAVEKRDGDGRRHQPRRA